MTILDSPFVIAISPVVVSAMVTIYATRKNKQINPPSDELVKELRNEIKELKEK